jgi:hypothetical protein
MAVDVHVTRKAREPNTALLLLMVSYVPRGGRRCEMRGGVRKRKLIREYDAASWRPAGPGPRLGCDLSVRGARSVERILKGFTVGANVVISICFVRVLYLKRSFIFFAEA